MWYINMRDKAMSGWGLARGGRSYFSVCCHTSEQADAIFRAAQERREMVNVRVSKKPFRATGKNDHVSIRDFAEMGGPWLAYYRAPDECRASVGKRYK